MQGDGELTGYEVGIDIVGFAVFTHTQGGDNGDEVTARKQVDNFRVNTHHFPNLANINIFFTRCGVAQHELACVDEITVLTSQAHRMAALLVDKSYDVLID